MAEPDGWLALAKLAGAAMTVILVGIGGLWQGRKQAAEGSQSVNSEVVAATFTERALMERLIAALSAVDSAIRASTAETRRVGDLLVQDAQRRHDEVIVRQALKERGIVS